MAALLVMPPADGGGLPPGRLDERERTFRLPNASAAVHRLIDGELPTDAVGSNCADHDRKHGHLIARAYRLRQRTRA